MGWDHVVPAQWLGCSSDPPLQPHPGDPGRATASPGCATAPPGHITSLPGSIAAFPGHGISWLCHCAMATPENPPASPGHTLALSGTSQHWWRLDLPESSVQSVPPRFNPPRAKRVGKAWDHPQDRGWRGQVLPPLPSSPLSIPYNAASFPSHPARLVETPLPTQPPRKAILELLFFFFLPPTLFFLVFFLIRFF